MTNGFSKRPVLLGYVNTKDLAIVSEEDIRALDGINIAFAHVINDACVWQSDGAKEAMARIRTINPELKFILSVGGWSAGGFSEAASTKEGRLTFARSAAKLALDFDLDGIDIDWEYPSISMAGIKADLADKENFTLYLQAIRDELDLLPGRRRILSIAAGGDAYFCRNTEMDKVAKILDYVQIMTYDLRGGYTHATGHHTNMETPRVDYYDVSVRTGVEAFVKAGVPKEKIIIGSAFYARTWRGVPNVDNGYLQYAETVGTGGPSYDELVDEYIDKNGYIRHWDESAKAPWLFNGDTFMSYDDPMSLSYKVSYLKEEGLLGIMYWEYGHTKKHSLTQVIRDLFENT